MKGSSSCSQTEGLQHTATRCPNLPGGHGYHAPCIEVIFCGRGGGTTDDVVIQLTHHDVACWYSFISLDSARLIFGVSITERERNAFRHMWRVAGYYLYDHLVESHHHPCHSIIMMPDIFIILLY